MVLCVVGMGSVFILPAIGIPLGSIGSLLLFLLCPLSHGLMLWGLMKHRKAQDTDPAGPQPIASGARVALPSDERTVREG
jgi:hypothetical protein